MKNYNNLVNNILLIYDIFAFLAFRLKKSLKQVMWIYITHKFKYRLFKFITIPVNMGRLTLPRLTIRDP